MPDTTTQVPDAKFAAMQDQLKQLGSMQPDAAMRTGFMETFIDAVPLVLAAGVEDNGETSRLLLGIQETRRRQKELDFQQRLDLRKFQLTVGLAGLNAELQRTNEQRESLKTAAQIRESEASTDVQKLIKQQKEMELGEAEITAPARVGKTMQEYETEKLRTRVEQGKLTEAEQDLLTKQRRNELIQEMRISDDPIRRQTGEYALLFGEQPRAQNGMEAFGKATKIFPGLQAWAEHPTAEALPEVMQITELVNSPLGPVSKQVVGLQQLTKQIKQSIGADPTKALTKKDREEITDEQKADIIRYVQRNLGVVFDLIETDPEARRMLIDELRETAQDYGIKESVLIEAAGFSTPKKKPKPQFKSEEKYGPMYYSTTGKF